MTTLSFDIAGLELYLPLVSGGTCVIASREDNYDPARLMERIRESQCTVMQATPATWRALDRGGMGRFEEPETAVWRRSPARRSGRSAAAPLRRIMEHVRPDRDHHLVHYPPSHVCRRPGTDRPAYRQYSGVHSGRASPAGADGHRGRAVYRRRGIGPGLPGSPGTDGRALCREPLRAQGAVVSDWRSGALAGRRNAGMPGPRGQPGEDSGIPHRTGRGGIGARPTSGGRTMCGGGSRGLPRRKDPGRLPGTAARPARASGQRLRQHLAQRSARLHDSFAPSSSSTNSLSPPTAKSIATHSLLRVSIPSG